MTEPASGDAVAIELRRVSSLPSQNPQTWTRITRNNLRRLANDLGNEAMVQVGKWPASGEGRAIKAGTERISEILNGPQPTKSLVRAYSDLSEVANELDAILSNQFFRKEIAHKQFGERKARRPFSEAIAQSISDVRNFIVRNPPPEISVVEALNDLVPEQKIGPAQFEFVEGVLRLNHRAGVVEDRDRRNAEQAREGLVAEGSWLIAALTGSNAEGRLVELVQDMQDRLRSGIDVIQLGIANMTCQLVFEKFEEEFSLVLAGRMNGYSAAVGMYVSQFPEWARFSENAALAEYDDSDIKAIHAAGESLVTELRGAGAAVDDEVPHTLAWMLEAIQDPKKAARRTVYAAIRTIENLVVAVLRASGTILGGVTTGAKKGTELAFKGLVAVGILGAAATVATRVAPASSKILKTSWLGKAGKLVLKALEKEE